MLIDLTPADDREAHWKAKYDLLLDSATALREALKDIYNASCFNSESAPPGMLADFRKAVHESCDKVLRETVSVSRIQYQADLSAAQEGEARS